MTKYFLILVTILSIGLNSCNETTSNSNINEDAQLFTGEWKLDKMVLGTEIIDAKTLGKPTYTFNPNNTYVIHVSGQIEEGTWKKDKEQIILSTKDSDKETILEIKEISKDVFTYEINQETMSRVYLKRELKRQ